MCVLFTDRRTENGRKTKGIEQDREIEKRGCKDKNNLLLIQ